MATRILNGIEIFIPVKFCEIFTKCFRRCFHIFVKYMLKLYKQNRTEQNIFYWRKLYSFLSDT